MTAKIGSTRTTNDAANVKTVEINATTSTTLCLENKDRVAFYVTNDSANESWIKLQPASVDNEKKGVFLGKKAEPPKAWEMTGDGIYTGEISAIAATGTFNLYVTEY